MTAYWPALQFTAWAALLCAVCGVWLLPVLYPAQANIGRGPTPALRRGPWRASLWLAGGFVVLAAAGYAHLGNWQALAWSEQDAADMRALEGNGAKASDTDVAAMVDKLAEELSKRPLNAEALPLWVMLGRAQGGLMRFEEAAQSFAKAASVVSAGSGTELSGVLADQADALLAARQGNPSFMAGVDPAQLVQRAVGADPSNLKALALAGTLAFDARRYGDAVRHWERAVALAQQGSAGPELAASLQASLAEAQERAGVGQRAGMAASPASGLAVRGEVRLSPALAASAGLRPDDTVFVVARSADGAGGPPLAAQRFRVADLPLRFVLDDSAAMNPQRRLSQATEVLVSARVSRSGQALPQSGDLASAVQRVKPGLGAVNLEISAVVP